MLPRFDSSDANWLWVCVMVIMAVTRKQLVAETAVGLSDHGGNSPTTSDRDCRGSE